MLNARTTIYLIIPLVLSWLTLFPPIHWLIDLNKNLSGYYLIAHLVGLILIAINFLKIKALPRAVLAVLLLIQCGVIARPIVPFFIPWHSEYLASSENQISLYLLNVYNPGNSYSSVRSSILKHNPDVVGLVEVDQRWLDNISVPASMYPYRILRPLSGAYGLALYSKFPLVLDRESIGDDVAPVIVANLELPNAKTILLSLLHANKPTDQVGSFYRNLYLRRLASYLREQDRSMIVFGDFNATIWSKPYRQWISESKFKNAMHGYGLLKTWHANNPLLWLTIDHIFFRGELKSVNTETLDEVGSDHYPVLAKFELP